MNTNTALATAQATATAQPVSAEYAADLKRGMAPNTAAAYARQPAAFDDWRGQYGSAPATDAELARYSRQLEQDGRAAASISLAAAASFRARVNGHPSPRGPETAAALKAIRREQRHPGRGQSDPLTVEDVGAMLQAARQPARYGKGMESPLRTAARSRRDAAMIGLLFYAGMRRAEAAAITAADVVAAADVPGAAVVHVGARKRTRTAAAPISAL